MSGKKSDIRYTILVVDDDAQLRSMVCDILEDEGFLTLDAATGRHAVQLFESHDPDIVLLDLYLPDRSGQEVLSDMVKLKPEVPVVIISGHGTVPDAVDAVKTGARDFLQKPLDTDRLLIAVNNSLEARKLRIERDELLDRLRERYRMVGISNALTEICSTVDRVAPTAATVLITGETGVGKELVAQAIYVHSSRASKPFIRVNCAAIPDELIESELFGHERGSFTGATATRMGKFHRADGGTLFLDEVADMSPRTQAKVLRALESGEIEMVGGNQPEMVDVRIIAATNKNLTEEVSAGRFRNDLFYRLNAVRIDIPPLRERREDIVPLAEFFLSHFAETHNIIRKELSESARNALLQHTWPGNIRELRNLAERLMVMTDARILDGRHISDALNAMSLAPTSGVDSSDFKDSVKSFEHDLLIQSLNSHDWNVNETAEALNLTAANLYKKLKSHHIQKP